MKNKQYLNEEDYQKINKKVDSISKILLIAGGISFIIFTILILGRFISFETRGLISMLWVFSAAIAGFGLMLFTKAHSRQITAYMTQQQMPIVKESIEKMSPLNGKIAKEIAKGVKEGLEEDNQNSFT